MTTHKDARPKTADPDVWAATHTKAGELNAEGFRRGMSEGCKIGQHSIRLWLGKLRAPAVWGLQLEPEYVLVFNSDQGLGPMEKFSSLYAARTRYRVLQRAAQAEVDATPRQPELYW